MRPSKNNKFKKLYFHKTQLLLVKQKESKRVSRWQKSALLKVNPASYYTRLRRKMGEVTCLNRCLSWIRLTFYMMNGWRLQKISYPYSYASITKCRRRLTKGSFHTRNDFFTTELQTFQTSIIYACISFDKSPIRVTEWVHRLCFPHDRWPQCMKDTSFVGRIKQNHFFVKYLPL